MPKRPVKLAASLPAARRGEEERARNRVHVDTGDGSVEGGAAPHLRTLVALPLLLACLTIPRPATGHDSSLTWKTLRTPLAHVTYPAHLEAFARAAERSRAL